jgi:hypothetical protein
MKTFKCPACKKEAEVLKKENFEHKRTCPAPSNDKLERVWRFTGYIRGETTKR